MEGIATFKMSIFVKMKKSINICLANSKKMFNFALAKAKTLFVKMSKSLTTSSL